MRRLMGLPLAAVALSACVTINVYFPAAEAKEAAKEFVEKVIGPDAQAPAPEGKPQGQGASLPKPRHNDYAALLQRVDLWSVVGIGAAHAETPGHRCSPRRCRRQTGTTGR